MMRMGLSSLLALSLLFAVLFAAGGAGIFGSPFGGPWDGQKMLCLLTILAGPAACLIALVIHRDHPGWAGAALIGGAVSGALLGNLTNFRFVWLRVFAHCVWLPMTVVALCVWLPMMVAAVKRAGRGDS
jgi:hypothetical protein